MHKGKAHISGQKGKPTLTTCLNEGVRDAVFVNQSMQICTHAGILANIYFY